MAEGTVVVREDEPAAGTGVTVLAGTLLALAPVCPFSDRNSLALTGEDELGGEFEFTKRCSRES